jgi:hypothetical protein
LNARVGEYSKYVAFTAVVIGIGLMLFGIYSYWDASQVISDLEEDQETIERALQGQETIDNAQAQSIVFSDVERRERRDEMVDQQHLAQRYAGIGIALLAAAWIIRNLFFERFKKQMAQGNVPENQSSP